jgi:cytochrome oxidase assembly protein ShyY1
VPFRYQRAPVADAAPPDGPLTIQGFLLPRERAGSARPDANGVVGRPSPEGLRARLGTAVYPLAIQLTDQDEPQPGDLPVPIGWPELSEGPHLSYAIQWFSFAAIAVVGAVVLLRRERRRARSPAP